MNPRPSCCRLALALVLLAALAACGGSSADKDPGVHPGDVVVDVSWGGPDAPHPGADTRADPGAVPDGGDVVTPDGGDAPRDVATPEADAEPGPEPVPDTASPEPALDVTVSDPAPEAATDPATPDVPPDAPPDVPDLSDVALAESEPEDEPDLPPIPDTAECSVDAHCADSKPCTVDTCMAGVCKHVKAVDNSPCEDGDTCTTGDYCVSGLCFAGAVELCDDGNACTTDTCQQNAGCKHTPKSGTACNDGDPCSGNDTCLNGVCQKGALDLCPICGDGKCGEPYETCEDCVQDCGACSETACSDGVDEDWDGVTDCADPDCAHVLPCYEAACGDGVDNDGDGVTDCADPDCGATEPCIETSCGDGVDNDGDGATDCADSQCALATACLPAACVSVTTLTCGQTVSGSVWAGTNHLSGYSCSSMSGSYDDVLYGVVLAAGKSSISANLSITGSSDDLDLYLLAGTCGASACVDSSTGSSWSESVSASGTPGQIFFVIVEEYSVMDWGDFSLSITCN